MKRSLSGTCCAAVVLGTFLAAPAAAEPPVVDPVVAAAQQMVAPPRIEKLAVRVVDADGRPVKDAKVTPWALRSSKGHGTWHTDDLSGVAPREVFTDAEGRATIQYPYYHDRRERIRAIQVSLAVDHPEFAYASRLHIDVPPDSSPTDLELTAGTPVVLHTTLDGQPVESEDLYVLWSDGRSWRPGTQPQSLGDGLLQIPAMPPGANSVLVVKLDGERATHFSSIIDFELELGDTKQIDVALRPAMRVEGKLSDAVPRPVRQGRVKVRTLPPKQAAGNRVMWMTWAPVEADGTFVIDGWPADEPLQLVALCDGFAATNGQAPECVENPRDPAKDPFGRPQVFEPRAGDPIEVAMTPMIRCVATAVDEDEQPVAGLTVRSAPNVGWWNSGSQIYCHPMVRGEQLLRNRDYFASTEEAFPWPFEAVTGADGRGTLFLPDARAWLVVVSDVYELPVFLGRREVRVELTPGKTTEALLRLQPKGTEKLGEWDKLAGVVFGCSTREGRRICALPGVRQKMDEFTKRFREGKNQRDPRLLSEAYTLVADAFAGVGDTAEAAKWRKKAAQQAELAESGNE